MNRHDDWIVQIADSEVCNFGDDCRQVTDKMICMTWGLGSEMIPCTDLLKLGARRLSSIPFSIAPCLQ